MLRIVRFVLSLVIGCFVGFVLMLISTGVFQLVCCGLTAFLSAGFTYAATSGMKGFRTILSVAAAIVGFVLYVLLLQYIDENAKTMLLPLIIGFAPFGLVSWLFFRVKAEEETSGDN